MIPKNNIVFFLLVLFCAGANVQGQSYEYRREIKGISNQWHKIVLPDGFFRESSPDLYDIRILGITNQNDTIEAPYLLRQVTGRTTRKEIGYQLLNTSHNPKGYYYTFKMRGSEPIDQIELKFEKYNFDWYVTLDGSQDQTEWFTVLEDYRILSIKNESIDFQFATLNFPTAKYRYYRLFVPGNEKPGLSSATIVQQKIAKEGLKNYPVKQTKVTEHKQDKLTTVEVELPLMVPVNTINITVHDQFDYYRPLEIQYLADSFKITQGWKYSYQELTTGVLSSDRKNGFSFPGTIAKKLKIIIYNQDNTPLTIDSVQVKGGIYELVARFTQPASYFLVYGRKAGKSPSYDIRHYADKIPPTLKALKLGVEQSVEKVPPTLPGKQKPPFAKKFWLWSIMIVIIVVLGWFSLKMMKRA